MDIGAYKPETAKMILETVRYLRANGLVGSGGGPPGLGVLQGDAPILVKNDSGEEVPPYSVMQITGTIEENDRNYILIDKHDDSVFGDYLFNGPTAIEDDGYGVAQRGPVYRAQGDGSTVTSGDIWGIDDGTWEITDEGTLFIVLGEDDVEDDVVRIMDANIRGRSFGAETPAAGIPAMSGTTPGNATCDLYVIDYAGTWVDTGLNSKVYNIMDSSVTGSERILVSPVNDKFIAFSENCPGGAGSSNPT